MLMLMGTAMMMRMMMLTVTINVSILIIIIIMIMLVMMMMTNFGSKISISRHAQTRSCINHDAEHGLVTRLTARRPHVLHVAV